MRANWSVHLIFEACQLRSAHLHICSLSRLFEFFDILIPSVDSKFRSIAMKTSAATAILGLSTLASAHGYVQQIWLGENLVDAWNPYKDPQKAGVSKITRKFKDNGPVTDGLFTVSNS